MTKLSLIEIEMRFPLLLLIFFICSTFFGITITSDLTYESRVRVKSNGLEIKPILRVNSEFGNNSRPSLWVDTSVFDNNDANGGVVREETCSRPGNDYCLRWRNKAAFRIVRINEYCEMHEMSTELSKPLSIAFSLEGVQLYGGSEMSNQSWPTQKSRLDNVAFASNEKNTLVVLERYWLTSAGQSVHVDKMVPLFVSQNETTLLLTAELREPYVRKTNKTVLKYRYCHFENAKIAHLDAIANVFDKPKVVPDRRMVQFPIWSTWATYKTNVTERNVYEFANAIRRYGFPNSALEIDDMWETCYGSLTVDVKKFPDMKRHVDELKKLGFRVTLWTHPFVNVNCEPSYTIARESGYLVKSQNGSLYTHWWNGDAGVIDFTNRAAAKWFSDRLKKVMNETGIHSYKFDAGESGFSPQVAVYADMTDDHPETFVRAYVKTANEFGNMVEIVTASGVQDISPFVRMMDRETKWTGPLAFDTIVPTLLHMNIIGYPFVLPDMIGGNAYKGDVLTEEMYIRWVQLNVFMPALQFSLPPWLFSTKAIEITKNCIDLHKKYADRIYELMVKSTKDGTPVNLPLWWIDPDDSNTYVIDSEFLLGEDLLVAPIIKEGARARDIYLPKGQWRDENRPEVPIINGPVMLNNYKVDLDTLPFFRRIDDDHSKNSSPVTLPGLLYLGTLVNIVGLIFKRF